MHQARPRNPPRPAGEHRVIVGVPVLLVALTWRSDPCRRKASRDRGSISTPIHSDDQADPWSGTTRRPTVDTHVPMGPPPAPISSHRRFVRAFKQRSSRRGRLLWSSPPRRHHGPCPGVRARPPPARHDHGGRTRSRPRRPRAVHPGARHPWRQFPARWRADDLRERLEQRMAQPDREARILAPPPSVIGGLVVVPMGLIAAMTGPTHMSGSMRTSDGSWIQPRNGQAGETLALSGNERRAYTRIATSRRRTSPTGLSPSPRLR